MAGFLPPFGSCSKARVNKAHKEDAEERKDSPFTRKEVMQKLARLGSGGCHRVFPNCSKMSSDLTPMHRQVEKLQAKTSLTITSISLRRVASLAQDIACHHQWLYCVPLSIRLPLSFLLLPTKGNRISLLGPVLSSTIPPPPKKSGPTGRVDCGKVTEHCYFLCHLSYSMPILNKVSERLALPQKPMANYI